MTIEEMHYDFKKKLNKIDSQQFRNLLVPEIDWVLNEAQDVFIDMVAEPRVPNHYLGFEKSQKNLDDIKTIVVDDYCYSSVLHSKNSYNYVIPFNYRYFVKAIVHTKKDNCKSTANIIIRQHDDNFQDSPFDKSSFEWKIVNATFWEEGIKVYTDSTFILENLCMTYIRIPKRLSNAKNFNNGQYRLPMGTIISENQNCELPEQTHREIVDLAVLIATGEIQGADSQTKLLKLKLNGLIP